MKHISKYSEYVTEKVNLAKYLPQVGKAKSTNYPAEVRAFLDVIAFAEGTYKFPKEGYNTQYSGKQFHGYEDHPRDAVTAGAYTSTAAGRYQFLSKTWDGLMSGQDFSPQNQDEGVVKLLKQRRAYRPLLKGNVKKALYRTRNIWASFPWSKYGQGAWYAKNDTDKYEVLRDLYYTRLKQYDPSAEVPDINLDDDISVLSKEEQSRIGSKKRSGSGYGDDSMPFTVGGSSGEKVVELQKALIKLGGSLPVYGIDGLFGAETMGASKFVLQNIAEHTNTQLEGTITNELSENNIETIISASNNPQFVAAFAPKFKKAEYEDYSQNHPMVDGEIVDGEGIYYAEGIKKFIQKLKDKKPVSVYHIGDSHIKAPWYAGTIEKGLKKFTQVDYDKNAENGWSVARHLKNKSNIVSDLNSKQYDLVIISLGSNDSFTEYGKFNVNNYKSLYSELINLIKELQPNAEILLTTPTSGVYPLKSDNPNKNKVLTQKAIYELASKHGIATWDIFEKMGGVDSILQWDKQGLVSDGVHFKPKGYAKIGDRFISDLKNYID